MLDIPMNIVSTAIFHQFVIRLMEHGIETSHLAPDKNLAEVMMAPFHAMLADALCKCTIESFSQWLEMIRRGH
jgi:hypothetical protein